MSKPYCGVRKLSKNRERGTIEQCLASHQVRYYGISSKPNTINNYIKKKEDLAKEKAKKKRQDAIKKKADAKKAAIAAEKAKKKKKKNSSYKYYSKF